MAEAYRGVISEIKKEGWNDGWNGGEKNIIIRLLKNHSLDEVSELLEMESSEILDIINRVD